MNLLQDIITYIRRIVKTPSNNVLNDTLILDYINRFWINDVDARLQLFDLKKKYQFVTTPGVSKYNMPLYSVQTYPNNLDEDSPILTAQMYPVYQGFTGPVWINGISASFYTQNNQFYSVFPEVVQYMNAVEYGNGTAGPYYIKFPVTPQFNFPNNFPPSSTLLRGHVDIQGIISAGQGNVDPPLSIQDVPNNTERLNLKIPVTSVNSKVFITSTGLDGSNIVVQDSGQMLRTNKNYGLLMRPGKAPLGNTSMGDKVLQNSYSTTLNTVNYFTGEAYVYFNEGIPSGMPINVQAVYYQTGLPRGVLFYNNVIEMLVPPDKSYQVELDGYMTPAAFLNSNEAIPFGYMSEYIARGAARKILSDTGDVEQFNFYEPFFKEQEDLVHIRSQRQWTSTRTQTIYSQGVNQGWYYNGNGTNGAGVV